MLKILGINSIMLLVYLKIATIIYFEMIKFINFFGFIAYFVYLPPSLLLFQISFSCHTYDAEDIIYLYTCTHHLIKNYTRARYTRTHLLISPQYNSPKLLYINRHFAFLHPHINTSWRFHITTPIASS